MGTPHRVEQVEIFHFDQLSDGAKEKAREWWRRLEQSDMAWAAERRDTMDAFAKEFNVTFPRWEYDQWTSSVETSCSRVDDAIRDLEGPRLMAYLWNNHKGILYTPKVYEVDKKKRRSRVILEETSCPFTGYCMDDDILQPIRDFMKKPVGFKFDTLMDACGDAWGKSAQEDLAWIMADEQVDETIMANEYEFTVEGERV